MSLEAIVLAALNACRPTGIATVYALLGSPRPQRNLIAYLAAGICWSVAVGIVVVSVLHGVTVETGSSKVVAAIDVVGGLVALTFAVGFVTGRGPRPPAKPGAGHQESRLKRSLRDPSLKVAAGAGVATHLPGLFYLLGLNAIAFTDPGIASGVVYVAIFNAIWFMPGITSLILSVRRPEAARASLAAMDAWGRRHRRALVTIVLFGVGIYFTAKGLVNLI